VSTSSRGTPIEWPDGRLTVISPWPNSNSDPPAPPKTKHKKNRTLISYFVSGHSALIIHLFPYKDKPLLVRWETLLLLDLGLDTPNWL
jgi:hypothetical protein